MLKTLFLIATLVLLKGCSALFVGGAVVGAATKVAVETVKVPVKVTGAAVDAVTDDDDDD